MLVIALSLLFGLTAADAGGHAWLWDHQSPSPTESGMSGWQLVEPSFLVDGSSDDRHESASLISLVSPQNPPPPPHFLSHSLIIHQGSSFRVSKRSFLMAKALL